jgi:two-component system cell cycle sensor histidine kinase/response regulator CckA
MPKANIPAVNAVLVVDDEATIRALERRVLHESGYDVAEAADGQQALDYLAKGQPLALLVADLDMPVLSGDKMVEKVRALRPDLKVLFVTAHIDRLMDTRPLWEGEAFLEKPFTINGLREAVSLLLYGTITKTKT